jgi:N-acetylglucosamine kinase-like BadF-type ATPase
VTAPLVLAVDGGNSKTHLALVDLDGRVRALVRGPLSSPHHLGVDGCLSTLERLLDEAAAEAGVARGDGPVAAVGKLYLAGIDFPVEEDRLQELIAARDWATRVTVGNDTYALLRAGTERGWGVAVVCGAGINCLGVAPDGRQARFAALGEITGDWGGGYDVGMAAVSAAARSEDGRGPTTSLAHTVPRHFGLATAGELAEAFHLGRIDRRRVLELPPLVFQEAARAALTRLDLTGEPAEVVVGGGLLRSADGRLLDAIGRGLTEVGPDIRVHATAAAPVVGAALLGLDELGAGPDAQRRAREELAHAVERAPAGSVSAGG